MSCRPMLGKRRIPAPWQLARATRIHGVLLRTSSGVAGDPDGYWSAVRWFFAVDCIFVPTQEPEQRQIVLRPESMIKRTPGAQAGIDQDATAEFFRMVLCPGYRDYGTE